MRCDVFKAAMSVLILLMAALPLEAATIIVQPGPENGKDISLYKRTDLPLSSGPSLYAINTGPPGPGLDNFASLVEFDLTELTVSAAAVASAKLWLYENNVSTFSFQHVSAEFTNTIEVQPAATSWSEDTVFYSTLPEPLAEYSVTQVVDSAATWFSWDVTDDLRDWLSGALPNNGFLITSKFEVRNGTVIVGSAFDASEQNNPPYLEIELMNLSPGDYNRNGQVDAADYVVWRKQFGNIVEAFTGADGNGDEIVNAPDYTVWRDNFGNDSGASPIHIPGVPEPVSAALLALAGVIFATHRCMLGRVIRIRLVLLALFTLLVISASTHAAVIPFTEDFSTGTASWKNASNADVTYAPSGGPGGASDGYISVQRTFTANPNSAQTIFRGQDQFDSSGDAFVGNWLAAGITRFSYWVRHNAASDLTFGTRFATSANSPGANGIGTPINAPPNVWTMVEIPISPADISPEPPSTFNAVFGSIGNLQISVRPGNNLNTQIAFDLDRVTIVPEPATYGMLCLAAAVGMLIARYRRSNSIMPIAVLTAAISFAQAFPAFADTNSEPTSVLTPLPEPLTSFGAASHRGWLYVYGGHVGETHEHSRDNVRGSFRRQSLSGGKWEELPPGPAVQSPALVAHGNYLYLIGGLTARNAPQDPSDLHSIDSVARYEPDAGMWKPLPSLPEPRSSHDAVILGDCIYVAGGWKHHGEEGNADWHDSLLVLDLSVNDPAGLKWRKLSTTPFKRRAFAMATHNGRVYCLGGMTPDTAFSGRVDIYDPQNDTWSRGPSLPESEMNGFGASAFGIDGRLYVSSLSDKLLCLAEDENDWQPVASIQQPRFFHRIVPGNKNFVLLIGGADRDSHLDSITAIRSGRRD
jgi:hypothetical protein